MINNETEILLKKAGLIVLLIAMSAILSLFIPVASAQNNLTIEASTSSVHVGVLENVGFKVTRECGSEPGEVCTAEYPPVILPASGVSIQLTGAASEFGTTDGNGDVIIPVTATSQGTITATASKTNYTDASITIHAYALPLLKITADTSFVYTGISKDVKFTVTQDCQGDSACTQGSLVQGALVQLTGAATGSGTTVDGTVTKNIIAGSQGTITATASKAGYTSGTATIKAELPPNLIIAAYPDTVYAGTPQNVKFTVTENCPPGTTDACTQGSLVLGASVQLTGVATGNGTTVTDGTVTININASSQGTITATASKAGHTDGSTTILADYFPLAKIAVEKTRYFRGEPVNFTFTNTGTTTIETGLWLIWNTSQKISPINTTAIAGDFLAPGESVYFSWNQRDNKGQQVPPWTYKGSATYNNSFITYTDPFEITSCSLPRHTDQTYSSYVSEPVTFSVPLDTSKSWNVKWYLNGTQVKTDTGVTKSNYTGNAAVGVWNVTAVADSGCNSESWTITWTVNDIPVAKLTTERNNYSVGEIVVLTLTNIGTVNLTPDLWGIWNISLPGPVYTSPQLGANVLLPGKSVTYSWDQKDNKVQQVPPWQYRAGISWTFQGKTYWNYTKPFEIIKCVRDINDPISYSSEVGTVITFRTGNLTSTLKSWNVTWYLNGIEVHNETGVTGVSNYTNNNAAVGVWNVTAVAIHGCDLRRWTITWTVTPKPSNPPTGGGGGGSSGGGGGGGGITTAEPFANILKFERQDADLIRNSAVPYTFVSPVFSIYQVLVTGKENEGQVGIRIEHLKDTSALVSRIPAGIIYANENIWIGSKRIDSVVLRFRVNNSWITENGFEKTEIKLLRFDNGWKKLNTREINSDSTYTYFESGSPGLSSFAVSGIKEVTQDARGIQALVEDTNPDAETDLNNSNPTETSPGFGVIAGIGIISVAYLIRRRK